MSHKVELMKGIEYKVNRSYVIEAYLRDNLYDKGYKYIDGVKTPTKELGEMLDRARKVNEALRLYQMNKMIHGKYVNVNRTYSQVDMIMFTISYYLRNG